MTSGQDAAGPPPLGTIGPPAARPGKYGDGDHAWLSAANSGAVFPIQDRHPRSPAGMLSDPQSCEHHLSQKPFGEGWGNTPSLAVLKRANI